MRLTTKALRGDCDDRLVDATASRSVTLAGISQRQKISLSYLEQLFGKLRRHELSRARAAPAAATRWLVDEGHHGGRRDLRGRRAARRDAVRGKENCQDEGQCMTHELWANLNKRMIEYLDSVTLAELVDQQRARESEQAPRPCRCCASIARAGIPTSTLQRSGSTEPAHAGHLRQRRTTSDSRSLRCFTFHLPRLSATTPVDPRVSTAWFLPAREVRQPASRSTPTAGRPSRRSKMRASRSRRCRGRPEGDVWTSGATESINLALKAPRTSTRSAAATWSR